MGKVMERKTNMMMEYIKPEAAAVDIGLDLRTIQRWCKDKKIPAYKLGREWRIPTFAWDSFKAQVFSQVG